MTLRYILMNIIIEDMVVLKELIFNSFYIGRVLMVLKGLIFNSFYYWEGVVVLKELNFNSFYIGRVWCY